MQLNLQSSLLTDLEIKQKSSTFEKPDSWPDIRKNTQNGHIYLLADMRYPLGFTATVTGGYSVNIDGEHYADYNSQAQFSMSDWSEYTDTEGYTIDYPTNATKAHIIDIYPQTDSNDITRFQFKRVSGSVQEEQGCLWCHFNLNTSINLQRFSAEQNTVWQKLCEAITAKNNTIKFLQYGTGWLLRGMPNIKYVPVLDCNNTDAYFNYMASNLTNLTSITVKNANVVDADVAFSESISIENIKFVNVDTSSCSSISEMFRQCRSLNKLPDLNLSSATIAFNFLTEAVALEDTILNISSATALERIGCYGKSNYFMSGFKGLRVSNEAPFTGSAPQINVSYTGMDRSALVQLFEDLPYNVGYEVVGSPTINNGIVSGFIQGTNYLRINTSILSSTDKFEIVEKAACNIITTATSGAIPLFYGGVNFYAWASPTNRNITVKISNSDNVQSFSLPSSFNIDDYFRYKIVIENNSYTVYFAEATGDFTSIGSAQLTSSPNYPATLILGTNAQYWTSGTTFKSAIDLNDTYIKVNDVYLFRGQPAMTKTLNCVGATGTADLTAEDKDIALNKGWSLTLS